MPLLQIHIKHVSQYKYLHILILRVYVSHKYNYVFNLILSCLPRCDLTRSLHETCTMVQIPCFRSGREDITGQTPTRWDHPYSRGVLGDVRTEEREVLSIRRFLVLLEASCALLSVCSDSHVLSVHTNY